MPVSVDDVRKVAQLARLTFGAQEEQRLVEELNRMLGYVALLDELDTAGVVPTAHVLPISNVFREDEPRPSFSQAEALANAPSSGHGHFRVPRVIE
jgi:aspartyl-tRNA(Asn)/glutamyl-tRNA(Gln) amidotransferase subunit C